MSAHGVLDGRYELISEIARGGMGSVYLARLSGPLGFSRLVAIKTMHEHIAANPRTRAYFIDELRLTSRLHHANIISPFDVFCEMDRVYIAMDFIEGVSLDALWADAAAQRRRVSTRAACAIVHDVLLGLHHAHDACDEDGRSLGIVHRDVSPHNVLVGVDGLARVIDFGVAKANEVVHETERGEVRGKLPYMAPELLGGARVDRTADVYSAGVVLWELLTGRPLFRGSPELVARDVSRGNVPPPSAVVEDVPAALDAVVVRATNRLPERRFPSAGAMADALLAASPFAPRRRIGSLADAVRRGAPAPVRTERQTTSSPRFDRREIAISAAALALLGLLGIGAGSLRALLATKHRPEPDTAAMLVPASPPLVPKHSVLP